MSNPVLHLIGAMSGTSADGVDVALVRIEPHNARLEVCLVHHLHLPYSKDLQARVFDSKSGKPIYIEECLKLTREISMAYASAVTQLLSITKFTPDEVAAVAAHGQTLFHQPPLTFQILDPSLIANQTQCPVISNFRTADCAADGQGAPLVPYADLQLFAHKDFNRIALNIGGISNLTWLPKNASPDQLVAFDTGPGNCISDYLVRRFYPDLPGYDPLGGFALTGKPDAQAVDRMLQHPYFHQKPPKSTDGPQMIEIFRQGMDCALADCKPQDLLATATLFTAKSIVESARRFLPETPDHWILSGGGIENQSLLKFFQNLQPNSKILKSDDLGIPSQAKESIAFALLGYATLQNKPGNIPAATGASRAVVLGSITPKP